MPNNAVTAAYLVFIVFISLLLKWLLNFVFATTECHTRGLNPFVSVVI